MSPKWIEDLKRSNTPLDKQRQAELTTKLRRIIDSYRFRVDSTNRVVYNSRQGYIKIPDQPSQEITNTSVMYR